MKNYLLFLCTIALTVTAILVSCASGSGAKATHVQCVDVVKTFLNSQDSTEVPQVRPLGDGGALVLLINPVEKSARGLIISSIHTRRQFEQNKIELKSQGQCQADGLIFEVSGFDVKAEQPPQL